MTSYDWTTLNRTELALMAREFNHEAHRWLPYDVLVHIIEDHGTELPRRFVNKKRLEVMRHINDNWATVNALVNCPAKTRDPRACYGCSDNQIACCTLENVNVFTRED